MNDELMKKMKKFEEDLRQPEDDLDEIRWFLGRFEYDRAWELVDVFEKTYEKLLRTAEMEEIQCRIWILKLECMTCGFQHMDLSRKEEEIMTGLFRLLIRMHQLPIRGMRYLFQREEYLRLQNGEANVSGSNRLPGSAGSCFGRSFAIFRDTFQTCSRHHFDYLRNDMGRAADL